MVILVQKRCSWTSINGKYGTLLQHKKSKFAFQKKKKHTRSQKLRKKKEAYLQSQSTCVLRDQKIGQIHEVGQGRIEKQIPDDPNVISCKG